MKKVLFIARCLEGGGVTKSIINLLNAFDLYRYEVHLFIMFDRKPELEALIPDKVIIHKHSFCNRLLSKYYGSAEMIKAEKTNKSFSFLSFAKGLFGKVDKAYAAWLLAKVCPSIEGDYDTIIDYYGQTQLYYMVDKLKSKKKLTFFHNDYAQFDTYKKVDRYYFSKVDRIFTISKTCVESIKDMFPKVADKVYLMENISSPTVINQLASKPVEIPLHSGLLFVSVGHVCERKGSDWAIEAARILKSRGYEFYWIILGSKGDPRFGNMIKNYELEKLMLLYGETDNPYPFIKSADIVVHPSRFEGKTIVLDEAKILCKPIVATNFSTVRDQLEDGVNATICSMSAESLADSIAELIDNPAKRMQYINYLSNNIIDNSNEVQKLYQIIDL